MKELEDKLKMIAGHDVLLGSNDHRLVRCISYLVLQICKHGEQMDQQSFIEAVLANALYILEEQ